MHSFCIMSGLRYLTINILGRKRSCSTNFLFWDFFFFCYMSFQCESLPNPSSNLFNARHQVPPGEEAEKAARFG